MKAKATSVRTIYKYPFTVTDEFTLDLPSTFAPLSVEVQPGTGPCLWALVDPDSPKKPVTFRIFGTGHPIDVGELETLTFVGTLFQGAFVWHLFMKAGT